MSVSSPFHQSEIGSSTLASVGRDASTCAVCCQVPSSAIRERFALRPHSDRELPSKACSPVTRLQQRLVKTGGRLVKHGGTTGCRWPRAT